MNLSTPVSQLNRVGSVLKRSLAHLGIETVEDLLYYFPFRYEDFSQVAKIKDLQDGQEVTVQGKIELIGNKRSPRKRTMITEALVADESGQLRIVWFGQPFIVKTLKVGDEVFFSGKVKSDMFGVQMVGPSYERMQNAEFRMQNLNTTHTARIVPMYSLTAGVTEKQLRFLVSQSIAVRSQIHEWVPEEIRDTADLMPIDEALRAIHFPESQEELVHAQKRLKFDELFLVQLRAEMVRQSIKKSKAPTLEFKEQETKEFVSSLPFELTKDQKVSAWEILQDMGKSEPMNRLLEGDVGSGKTVVAGMALYNTVLNGFQGVMMAPTEILASQHFESLVGLLGDKINIVLLTRSQYKIRNSNTEIRNKSEKENVKISKQDVIDSIVNGEAQVVVGTHALLSEDVQFKNLGLVIVDEQHRFGVNQRKMIKEKSGVKHPPTPLKGGDDGDIYSPHFLSMTATPIPRSFALTVYGDLDLSIIKQMPVGRKVIKTRLVDPHNREKAYQFIRDQVKQGRQVFVICPLIQEKTDDDTPVGTGRDLSPSSIGRDLSPSAYAISLNSGAEKKTVMDEYKKLSERVFPDLKVGFLHGKLKPVEKDETMKQFASGEIDILVATSVVEVGVNIPNASVMMIEGAERFGLAQLHQFRGRVGRSDHQSYCFLFTDSDSSKAQERLTFFEKTSDGFELAEYDLKVRGPGEVYGVSQSGMMNFKLATLQDHDIIKLARDMARGVDFEKYVSLKKRVEEWEEGVHLE